MKRIFQSSQQTKSIRAFMAARKRTLTTVNRSYPKFQAGMTTAAYIRAFHAINASRPDFQALAIPLDNYQSPAPIYVGRDDIIVEDI